MKALLIEKEIQASAQECANSLMETVPLVMGQIRKEMRRYRPADLSIPQFRALNFVRRNPDCSLSQVAEHLGLTLPSVSKLVDGLQERKLLEREIVPHNRRKMTLNLTAKGQAALKTTREATLEQLNQKLSRLNPEEQTLIIRAMDLLQPLFSSESALQESEPLELELPGTEAN